MYSTIIFNFDDNYIIREIKMRKNSNIFIGIAAALVIFLAGYHVSDEVKHFEYPTQTNENTEAASTATPIPSIQKTSITLDEIPAYSETPYTAVNDNQPFFTDKDYTTVSFETYSPLDSLGRCGVAYANVGTDIMPRDERGRIGMIKPSGWHTVKYENVDGKYLYNRCHLIGYQLSGENANERNLITGTRYLNIVAMLSFENMVAEYVNETNNHVLYRVTPMFRGNDLVARGVLMEGYSVEDNGEGICYNVFCYNIQPGIEIDYSTGDSHMAETKTVSDAAVTPAPSVPIKTENTDTRDVKYIGNSNSKKFHYPYCNSAGQIKEKNKVLLYGSRDDAISQGYSPCKICNP